MKCKWCTFLIANILIVQTGYTQITDWETLEHVHDNMKLHLDTDSVSVMSNSKPQNTNLNSNSGTAVQIDSVSTKTEKKIEHIPVKTGNNINGKENPHHSIEFKLSNLTPGIEYNYRINPKFDIGISLNYLPIPEGSIKNALDQRIQSKIQDISSPDYTLTVNLDNFSAGLMTLGGLGYYYPFKNGFNVSAGLFLSSIYTSIDGQATIESKKYDKNGSANFSAKLEVSPINPYLGIGWKSGDRTARGLAFSTSLGITFGVTPTVKADLTNCNSRDSEIKKYCEDANTDLQKEVKKVNNSISPYNIAPIFSFGFVYRF